MKQEVQERDSAALALKWAPKEHRDMGYIDTRDNECKQ